MKAVVAAFNQEKALVWAFSVITNLRMELFQALATSRSPGQDTELINTGECPPLIGSVCNGRRPFLLADTCNQMNEMTLDILS